MFRVARLGLSLVLISVCFAFFLPAKLRAEDTNEKTRRQALQKAKDRAAVPRSQSPSRQWTVGNDPTRQGHKNYKYSADPGTHGRYYEFDTPSGKRVVAEHTNDPGKSPHFHAGEPKGNSSDRNYDFKQNRYRQVDGKRHHINYPKTSDFSQQREQRTQTRIQNNQKQNQQTPKVGGVDMNGKITVKEGANKPTFPPAQTARPSEDEVFWDYQQTPGGQ